MSVRRLWLVSLTVLLGASAAVWSFWPAARPNPGLVEPRLIALQEPFAAVETYHFLDGGTIGVEIVDASGRTEQFAIPRRLGSDERYERVFVGALHDEQPGAAPVAHPVETKWQLVDILSRYSRGDPYMDAALAKLRGSPFDYARVFIHRVRGDYQE